jgi:hypothetical protein
MDSLNDTPFKITLLFEQRLDLLNAMETIRNKDVKRKSLIKGFNGRVGVIFSDELLDTFPDDGFVERYDVFARYAGGLQ